MNENTTTPLIEVNDMSIFDGKDFSTDAQLERVARDELCRKLSDISRDSMDALAAGVNVWDYWLDAGGSRENPIMAQVCPEMEKRLENLLKDIHLSKRSLYGVHHWN